LAHYAAAPDSGEPPDRLTFTVADLTFRNAEENDSDEIVRLLEGHLLGGRFLREIAGGQDARVSLAALVESADTEYGYEQATLAYRDSQLVGLFIGYPRDLLGALGPRTLNVLMRSRSPLSWPGIIRAHARLARAEPPFPAGSYVLRCICAVEPAVVHTLVAEAIAEAAEEECPAIVTNVYEEDGELAQILQAAGFREGDPRQIADRKLADRLKTREARQFQSGTGYIGESSEVEPPD
jgi:hypothetical protein